MSFPTPRPVPGPAGARPVPGPAVPVPPPAPTDRLEEVRERLAALDELPLEAHPDSYAAIDGLLRAALDGTDRVSAR